MEGQPMITYHELREISPEKARELVRKVLAKQGGDVSNTARILNISRPTVRRARDGSLEDQSRRPLRSPTKTASHFEKLIVQEAKQTGFRYRRLTGYLQRKFSHRFPEDTVKTVLRRNGVKKKTRRTANVRRRPLYDYESLMPFQKMQLDTKHLLDKDALPAEVYAHIKHYQLPLYEWNIIDVATRIRFTAYSHELSAVFGSMFLSIVLLWLRAHNVRTSIRIRVDNGTEFCGGSPRKLQQWNEYLSCFNASLDPIPPGAKHLQAIVENSHKADDEYFLMIHAERCLSTAQFLMKAQQCQDTWNCYRPSYGINMHGLTPQEKLKASQTLIQNHVIQFPVLLMEYVLKSLGTFPALLKLIKAGNYVPTKCRSSRGTPHGFFISNIHGLSFTVPTTYFPNFC
jgi:transposase